jgi:hypothetical protein
MYVRKLIYHVCIVCVRTLIYSKLHSSPPGPKSKVVHKGVLPCRLGRILQLKNDKTPRWYDKTPSLTNFSISGRINLNALCFTSIHAQRVYAQLRDDTAQLTACACECMNACLCGNISIWLYQVTHECLHGHGHIHACIFDHFNAFACVSISCLTLYMYKQASCTQ